MMMHANDPVPDVRALRPDTPDWLADLVHGLLAKNADDRPAGAATVAAALATRESVGGAATTVLPAAGAATTQRLDAVPPPPVVPPARRRAEPDRGGAVDPGLGARRGGRGRDRRAALVPAQGQRAGPRDARRASTPGTSQPAPTTEAPPTTAAPTPTPTPTPTPSPSPTADLAGDVESALSAFSDEVGVLERDGVLDKNAAKTLDDGVRNIRKALRDGDPQKVSDETRQARAGLRQGRAGRHDHPGGDRRSSTRCSADLNDAVDAYAAG